MTLDDVKFVMIIASTLIYSKKQSFMRMDALAREANFLNILTAVFDFKGKCLLPGGQC